MTDFEPMKPPDNLVDNMIKDGLSEAWAICPKVVKAKDMSLRCADTKERCFVFQDGKDCKNNPLRKDDFPKNCRECKAWDWGSCPFIYKTGACLMRRKGRGYETR